MHEIYFYKDKNGNSPIIQYMRDLAKRNDKDSRIKLTKIQAYINYLQKEGKGAGEPYIKHLTDDIWELRPIKDRILFAAWVGDSFILLHHFVKKTQKTPPKEIMQAMKNLSEMKERALDND